jgi:hypothetical protein
MAQTLPIETGTRVRVTGCGAQAGYRQGVFEGWRGDTLFLRDRAATTACPISSVEGLEASVGVGSRWKRGAVIGAVVGAVPAAALGVLFCYGLDDSAEGCQPSEAAGVAALFSPFGAVPGSLLGGLIGFFFKTEEWKSVSMGATLFLPRPSLVGGGAVGLAMRFRTW